MYAIKDTVTEKLSGLLSKSSDQQPQARPYTKEGQSVTSIVSFLLPLTYFEKISRDPIDVKPLRSLPITWRSKSFSWRDDCLDHDLCEGGNGTIRCSNCARKEPENTKADNYGETDSAGSISSGSDIFEDASDRHSFEQSMASDSVFVTPHLYDFFQCSLPNIVKGCQWILLYSTARHGISLRTLIRKSADVSGPCLLITGDKQGAVFGGLLEAPLNPTAKRKYQGTNQSFVFTTVYGEPRLFRPTGANRYFYMCLSDTLALGGGGNFALSLDGDLLSGSSGPCETFGNSCLAHNQEFELKNVELWGFTYAS